MVSSERNSALCEPRSVRVKIIAVYVLMGGLWILLSDTLLGALLEDPALMTQFQTFKGWFYVIATAWILYLLLDRYSMDIRRYVANLEKTEAALQEAQARLNLTLKASGMGVWDWDILSNSHVWDDHIHPLFGLEPGAFSGKVEDFIKMIHPRDLKRVRSAVTGALKGLAGYDIEYRIVWPDGSIHHIAARGVVHRDDEGHPVRMTGICWDVTENKNLEVRLRQAQKMEALGTLAGGIAHDFNNILGAVMGYTELVMWDMPEENPSRANLEEVIKATNRAKELVKQILAFSRQSEPQRIPLQISSIVKEVLKLLRASLPSTIEIKQDITTTGTLLGDSTQIHQVLMNLCTNSSHAMREKGGILEVRLADVDLDREAVSLHSDIKPGPYVGLTVTDTGHGIDPALKARIFDPFFTTKRQGEGTGMGLAVVHGIVKNHGGFIDMESEQGKGTTFRVFFPRLEPNAAVAPEDVMALPRGNERILFVDDEPALAMVGKRMLERLGYHVVCMTDSLEALEAFRCQSPGSLFNLVITDQTMPHMTGLQFAEQILSLRPEAPVILCSGFSESVTPEQVRQMGIRAYITKPLIMKRLAEVVRKILDER